MVNPVNGRAALVLLSRMVSNQTSQGKTLAEQLLPSSSQQKQQNKAQRLQLRLDRPLLDTDLIAALEASRRAESRRHSDAEPLPRFRSPAAPPHPVKPGPGAPSTGTPNSATPGIEAPSAPSPGSPTPATTPPDTTAPTDTSAPTPDSGVPADTAGADPTLPPSPSETPPAAGVSTPVNTNTAPVSARTLDALSALRDVFDRIASAGSSNDRDSALVTSLSGFLQSFAQTVGNARGGEILGDIVGRIETSVIGQGGFEFADYWRDPQLFRNLSDGLRQFAAATNRAAADALRDVIIRVGDKRLTDANPNNNNLQPLASAISRLGRALKGETAGMAALQSFLDRLPTPANTARDFRRYAGEIVGLLSETLADLRAGADMPTRLLATIDAIGALADLAHQGDDWLRNSAIQSLQSIMAEAAPAAASLTVTARAAQAYQDNPTDTAALSADLSA